MSRKTFGGCGFAPEPEWGAHIAPHTHSCMYPQTVLFDDPGNCLILTLVWTSENAATSTHMSPYMSRKTFGGWGFAPDPEWGGSYRPTPPPACAPRQYCLMFHFLKSSRKSLLLEAKFLAWNSPNTVWRLSSARTRWGSWSAPPDLLATIRGPTSKGKGGEGREGREGKDLGRGGEGRGGTSRDECFAELFRGPGWSKK